jgi:multiple sugar transport system substrate-binding protein
MPFPKRFAFAAALAASLALSACAGSSSQSSDAAAGPLPTLGPEDKVAITFESYNVAQGGTWADTVTKLISGFEAEHPNITVKAQAPANLTGSNTAYAANLQAEILAGQAPDVAQETFDALDWLATQGVVDPLEDVVGADALEAAFAGKDLSANYPGTWPINENARSLADVHGLTYGMPYVFSTPVLWYNKTALDAAGVTMPVAPTWDDIETIGKKLVAAGHVTPVGITCTVTGGDWCMQGIIKSAGGSIVSEDKKTIEFGDDGSVAAVAKMRDLYEKGVLLNADVTTMITSFSKGQSLLNLTTSNASATFMGGAKAGGWELAATKMPSFAGQPLAPTNSGSALFMVHQAKADPKKQAAAWEFIKYITGPDGVQAITEGIGYVPIRDTMASAANGPLNPWFNATPGAKVNVAQLQELQTWDSYPGNSYARISKLFSDAVQSSIYFDKDPKPTMETAQRDAQALVK